MTATNLQGVADEVVRRAQQQGYVVPREVREELTRAHISELLWKDVLALARASLNYRRGRYYYSAPFSERVRAELSHQRDIQSAVQQLIQQQQAAAGRLERREQGRIDFIQPVKVVTEDNRELTLLSRDLSATGIRLVGTHRLLGQKVQVLVPNADGPPIRFLVRVLWTCPIGDELIENGGSFLSVSNVEPGDLPSP
jgi:hypothetical protein